MLVVYFVNGGWGRIKKDEKRKKKPQCNIGESAVLEGGAQDRLGFF
jgi:hypothetical protein